MPKPWIITTGDICWAKPEDLERNLADQRRQFGERWPIETKHYRLVIATLMRKSGNPNPLSLLAPEIIGLAEQGDEIWRTVLAVAYEMKKEAPLN